MQLARTDGRVGEQEGLETHVSPAEISRSDRFHLDTFKVPTGPTVVPGPWEPDPFLVVCFGGPLIFIQEWVGGMCL